MKTTIIMKKRLYFTNNEAGVSRSLNIIAKKGTLDNAGAELFLQDNLRPFFRATCPATEK